MSAGGQQVSWKAGRPQWSHLQVCWEFGISGSSYYSSVWLLSLGRPARAGSHMCSQGSKHSRRTRPRAQDFQACVCIVPTKTPEPNQVTALSDLESENRCMSALDRKIAIDPERGRIMALNKNAVNAVKVGGLATATMDREWLFGMSIPLLEPGSIKRHKAVAFELNVMILNDSFMLIESVLLNSFLLIWLCYCACKINFCKLNSISLLTFSIVSKTY